jgi:hypothetical protein
MATTAGSNQFFEWLKIHKKQVKAARDERYASIKQHNEEQFIKDFRRARGVYILNL